MEGLPYIDLVPTMHFLALTVITMLIWILVKDSD